MRTGHSEDIRLSRRERRAVRTVVDGLAVDEADLARRLAPGPTLATRLLRALALCAVLDGSLPHSVLIDEADGEHADDRPSRRATMPPASPDTTAIRPDG
jgi:ParB-like chromosome segregation protein Spo0J